MRSKVVRKNGIVHLQIGNSCYEYNEHNAPIGEGAMGIVYLGRQVGTNQRVAIKMVRGEYANISSIRKRARQEASLMFMHRNLIEMLGYCEWQPTSGPIWIISRYVQGITIDNYLSRIPRNPQAYKQICKVLTPVFDALNYLHTGSTPILHLDIKPSNIMVENGNNVRLMDLGIASTEAASAEGGMFGTPNYAAPEQFDTKYGVVQPCTDVYQLSVTIYELITGTNPYDSPVIEEVKERHRSLMLPSHRNLPSSLHSVLQKAAHPDPAKRFTSIMAFKTEFLKAVSSKSDTKSSTRKTAAIVSIVCALILLGLLGRYWLLNIN